MKVRKIRSIRQAVNMAWLYDDCYVKLICDDARGKRVMLTIRYHDGGCDALQWWNIAVTVGGNEFSNRYTGPKDWAILWLQRGFIVRSGFIAIV